VLRPTAKLGQPLRGEAKACKRLGFEVVAPRELVLAPGGYLLAPREQVLATREQVLAPGGYLLAPREQVLAPREQVLAPREQVLATREQVLAPRERVLAPRERVLVPRERGLVPRERVAVLGRARLFLGSQCSLHGPFLILVRPSSCYELVLTYRTLFEAKQAREPHVSAEPLTAFHDKDGRQRLHRIAIENQNTPRKKSTAPAIDRPAKTFI
jgi:hypothetical protein